MLVFVPNHFYVKYLYSVPFPGSLIFLPSSSLAPGGDKMRETGNKISVYCFNLLFFSMVAYMYHILASPDEIHMYYT